MNIKAFLEDIYDYLPEEFETNYILNGIWGDILKNCDIHNQQHELIGLGKELCSTIQNEYPESNFYPREDGTIIRILTIGEKRILLHIKAFPNSISLTFKINSDDAKHTIDIYKGINNMRVSKTTIVTKEGTESFLCDIKYFNELNEPLTLNQERIEREKDETFAKEFNLPLDVANFFRHNYRYFKKYIEKYNSKINMREYELRLKEQELLKLSSPFELSNIIDFILFKTQSSMYEVLKSMGLPEPETAFLFNGENKEDLASILNKLADLIGIDGEIVVSENIIENLMYLLQGNISIESLFTRGYILKKSDNNYTLYSVWIDSSIVSVSADEITKEYAQELYSKNIENNQNPELKSFFNIDKSRF